MKTSLCKGETMRAVLGILILFTCLVCKGQSNHVGALFTAQFEGQGSGNGTIAGVEIQNKHNFTVKKQTLQIATNASYTRDLKAYLTQYGTTVRVHTRARWYIANSGIFVQGGAFAGATRYLDPGGYAKGAIQPAAGFGYTETFPDFEMTSGYLYLKRSNLQAQHGFFDSTGRHLDGWTSGHNVTFETAYTVKQSKWLVLLNLGWQLTHYQRNPAVYGAAAGAVDHKYNTIDLSIGVGRKY